MVSAYLQDMGVCEDMSKVMQGSVSLQHMEVENIPYAKITSDEMTDEGR